jgi:uncharacterized membrane-anchored protein
MKKIFLLCGCMALFAVSAFADKDKSKKKKPEVVDSATNAILETIRFRDSLTNALKYETGSVALQGGAIKLNVPVGFRFLNGEQSRFVVHNVWGNPERDDVLGMIFPANKDPFSDSSFAFIISFEDMGYVKDGDAKDLDYDDMLKEMQKEEVDNNKQRTAMGYEAIHIIGWAQKPFYDEKRKVLHWAKNIRFGNAEENTLNYDVRVLGRKGVLSLNAVASMNELPLVQQNIDQVLGMAEFTEGNKYADFSESSGDKIAAYTIGGLVAGKLLLKIGFFAKFWKIIAMGAVAAFYGIRKLITGKGKKDAA